MSSSSSLPYTIIGVPIESSTREGIYAEVKKVVQKNALCNQFALFPVPLNLKFGSFDDLIRTVDEFPRHESVVEGMLKRLQRQASEINPGGELNILLHGKSLSVEQYIKQFTWDDSKYPRIRYLRENLEYLMQNVYKLDDQVKLKASGWAEAKSKSSEVSKKDNASFSQADLLDVLTPNVVKEGDFIETEHLRTLVVYVGRGLESEWKSTYETLEQLVVPRSTKKFDLIDKEGGTLWRVIIFKSSYTAFVNAAKKSRFVIKDFQYSHDAYAKLMDERTKNESEKMRQETFLARVCAATFSDMFIATVHLKAMRLFCEAVLRFGVPPNFAAIILRPTNEAKMKRLRNELHLRFNKSGIPDLFKTGSTALPSTSINDKAEEEYYSYVSINLSTFSN